MRDEAAVRIRAGWLSLAVGALIFAGKLGAFALTGSAAVFSDAMESVVNVAAAVLLLYSLIVAARPADRDHPYGHGKVEFFSAGVEGTLIAMAALAILVEAGRELVRGPELRNLDRGLLLLAGLTLANGVLGAYLVRVGRRTGSLALEADGRHLWTDVATSVGVLAGLGAVRVTGFVVFDPLVAIAVALNILREGVRLVRRAVGGLMDEADSELLARAVEALERGRRPWWIDVHGLRLWRSGAVHHADLHACVPRYFDADQLHEIDDELRRTLLGALDAPGDVLVHFDPCRPRQCPICAMPDCAVRAARCDGRPPLTLQRATRGEERLETGEPVAEAAP
jgi:cation diffusion facilitator family transporter